jgi:hypothetical protein
MPSIEADLAPSGTGLEVALPAGWPSPVHAYAEADARRAKIEERHRLRAWRKRVRCLLRDMALAAVVSALAFGVLQIMIYRVTP